MLTDSTWYVPDGATLVVGDTTYPLHEGEPVTFERDYEEVFSEGAVKPNPSWHITHGDHEHRWDDRSVTAATRSTKHIPCDGSCGGVCQGEGYDVPVWLCETTGEELDPGTVPDPGPHRFLRGETWRLPLVALPELPNEIAGAARIEFRADGKAHIVTLGDARLYRGDLQVESGKRPIVTYSGGIQT